MHNNEQNIRIKKIVMTGLFTACAIAVNVAENMIPMPMPGVKLGASNIFVLTAIIMLGTRAAFTVTFLRVLLVWLLTGNIFAFFCSMAGAPISTAVMALMYKKFDRYFSLPWISVAGAWAFNIGQLCAVSFIVENLKIAYYILPLLAIGTVCGWAVGKAAGIISDHINSYCKFHPPVSKFFK